MSANGTVAVCDGQLMKRMAQAGLLWLQTHQEKVNQLNVFPVPDGDTGTNMFLTMRRAVDEIASDDDVHVGNVCGRIADGALEGARGNSGVILSQWWRGFADVLRDVATFNGEMFARACQSAVERAYRAVDRPVEGTILTVTRQAMEAVSIRARLEQDLRELFETKVHAAYDSLHHTPELLPILRDAGVVDSGGQGWTFLIEGMLRMLRGEDLRPNGGMAVAEVPDWADVLVPKDEKGYGYDVQFLMRGDALDLEQVRKGITAMGWSTLVVGSEQLIKVHVHVHDPGIPLSYAIGLGASLDDIVVENMHRQYERYVAERSRREAETPLEPVTGVAVVTAVVGAGLRDLFAHDLGAAHVVVGGQTMNPSTEDFMKAIRALANREIILLPNNPNVILAARQAASLITDRQVRVVPSRSIPQGIAALLEYGNQHDLLELDELVDVMNSALTHVITGEITVSTRSVELDGVFAREGQLIGLLDDRLVVSGDDMLAVARELLRCAGADKHELITLYSGEDVLPEDAQALVSGLAHDFPAQEFQVIPGGQPLYPYVISVE